MEKIGLITKSDGVPIVGRVEMEEAVLKVNEIVDWINGKEEIWKELVAYAYRHEKGEEK